jgi:hypothetical protein
MGRRQRQRQRRGGAPAAGAEPLQAPRSDYRDEAAGVLTLRGSLPPAARAQYAETLRGGLDRDDAGQRAAELLFERLAVAWTIAGVRTERQRELLARYRAASQAERGFVRRALREHVEANFPELEAP